MANLTKRPAASKKPAADEKKASAFIAAAPDAAKKGTIRGKREQISHTMPPALLAEVDAMAERKGLSRAGLINLAVSEYIEKAKINF